MDPAERETAQADRRHVEACTAERSQLHAWPSHATTNALSWPGTIMSASPAKSSIDARAWSGSTELVWPTRARKCSCGMTIQPTMAMVWPRHSNNSDVVSGVWPGVGTARTRRIVWASTGAMRLSTWRPTSPWRDRQYPISTSPISHVAFGNLSIPLQWSPCECVTNTKSTSSGFKPARSCKHSRHLLGRTARVHENQASRCADQTGGAQWCTDTVALPPEAVCRQM